MLPPTFLRGAVRFKHPIFRGFRSSPSSGRALSRLTARCKARGFLPAACFHCWTKHDWAKRDGVLLAFVSDARNISTLETIILQSRSYPWCCRPAAQECVDRTNLQATITNENREAAPRPRRPGVLPNRTHMGACSMERLCARIRISAVIKPSPAARAACARSGRLGRNNHYARPRKDSESGDASRGRYSDSGSPTSIRGTSH